MGIYEGKLPVCSIKISYKHKLSRTNFVLKPEFQQFTKSFTQAQIVNRENGLNTYFEERM